MLEEKNWLHCHSDQTGSVRRECATCGYSSRSNPPRGEDGRCLTAWLHAYPMGRAVWHSSGYASWSRYLSQEQRVKKHLKVKQPDIEGRYMVTVLVDPKRLPETVQMEGIQ